MASPSTGRRRCHYEVLGVDKNVKDDELKKVYRQMALKMHPDKNRDMDPEAAKEAFQELQQAYEVLSDPQERAWYDAHREAILQGGGVGGDGGDVDVGGIDLFQFFSSSCYKGFGEGEGGFYAIYRHLFKTINEEDQGFSDETLHYPDFGDAQSSDEVWQEFYAFFSGYSTPRSYSWLDKYDTRQAENRRVVRAMEKENKKIRDAARKERNDLVRELVKFVRKRDKRIQEFNRRLEEKTAENARKTEEMRLKHLEERARMLDELKDAETPSAFDTEHMESQLQNLEDAYDTEEEAEENYCVACNKQLRNVKAYTSHLKQKKHLENVRALKEAMEEEGVDQVTVDFEALGIEKECDLDPEHTNNSSDEKGDIQNENFISSDAEVLAPTRTISKTKKKKKGQANKIDNSNGEAKENGDETGIIQPAPDAKAKKSRRANKKSNNARAKACSDEEDNEGEEMNDKNRRCAVCNNSFDSKNKLFAHLKSTGHSIYLGDNSRGEQQESGRRKKKR